MLKKYHYHIASEYVEFIRNSIRKNNHTNTY